MIRFEMKNCNAVLTEKQQKHQHYHQVKLINTNILQMKKHYLLDQSGMIEFAKSANSPLGEALEKQSKKQLDALNSSNLSNKIDELKQIECIFPKNQLVKLIIVKFIKIKQLQNNIRLDDLTQKATKRGRYYNFSKYLFPIAFTRDIHKRNLPLQDVDEEQSQLIHELKDMGKARISAQKRLLSAREKVLNNFKNKMFPIKNLDNIPTAE